MSAQECIERLTIIAAHFDVGVGMIHGSVLLGGSSHELEFYFEDKTQPDLCWWYDIHGNIYDWAQGKLVARYDHSNEQHTIVDTIDSQRSGLFRIETCIYISQMFWEEYLDGEDIYQVIYRVEQEFDSKYADLIIQYQTQLGLPSFSGSRNIQDINGNWIANSNYPIGQWGQKLTYWVQPEGVLQVQLTQEDKELPFLIKVAYYRHNTTS